MVFSDLICIDVTSSHIADDSVDFLHNATFARRVAGSHAKHSPQRFFQLPIRTDTPLSRSKQNIYK
jgi:hypothetical protein